MPFINEEPLNYLPNTSSAIRIYRLNRAPTTNDYRNFIVGDEWWDTSSQDFWKLVFKTSTSGIWRKMAGTAAATEFFITDDANITGPNGLNQINLLGGAGIVTSGNPVTNTLTIALVGGGTAIDTVTPDSGGAVSPDAVGNINYLGDSVGYQYGIHFFGDPPNNTVSAVDLRNTTKYVVDATALETEYTTIQSALNAANAAGIDATISVRPGTYTENLTLYDGLQIIGATGFSDANTGVEIIGVHTPPNIGGFVFRNVKLTSATDVINSAVAGSAHLIVADAAIAVTNGYLLNVLNWTGTLELWDVNCSFGTNDGCINNTGGATILCYSGAFGVGNVNSMIVSGNFFCDSAEFFAPLILGNGTNADLPNSVFNQTITTSGNATAAITNCSIVTGANVAISHGSANPLTLSQVAINTSNNPAITGAGAGTLTLSDVTFLSNAVLAGTLTLGASSIYPVQMANGELLIGSAGQPAVAANLTSTGGTITITNGAGSINLETAGVVAVQYDEDVGSAVPALGILNINGGNNISTSGAGNTVTINVSGTTNHTVQVGNATGSLTSLAAATNGQLVIGSTGADPSVANLTSTGGTVTITNGAGTINLEAVSGGIFNWVEVTTATQAIAVNTGYITNRAGGVTYTLPASAALGDIFRIAGNVGTYVIAQNVGQQIGFGNQSTTPGVGGSISSYGDGGCVELLCVTTDTTFIALSSIGNFSIV